MLKKKRSEGIKINPALIQTQYNYFIIYYGAINHAICIENILGSCQIFLISFSTNKLLIPFKKNMFAFHYIIKTFFFL